MQSRRLALAWAALALGCPQAEQKPAAPEPAAAAQAPAPALAPSGKPYSEPREACRNRNPLRNPYFGDTHVHTGLSMDASLWDVRTTPDDAYRFARGESIALVSSGAARRARLERPLDFVAVTDHSEFLGEVSLCTRADSPIHDSENCRRFRGEIESDGGEHVLSARFARLSGVVRSGGVGDVVGGRSPEVCGEDGLRCLDEMRSVWKQVVAAADRFDDRSAECRFTAFPAYEYTATPEMTKVHHNVIFRNANVPALPITWAEKPVVWDLWSELRAQCLDANTGCDVLTIPHNSNLSNGQIFTVDYKGLPEEEQIARARLRARLEPLVEISQIKGDSECRNHMYRVIGASDELCDYEQLRPPSTDDCIEATGKGALAGNGCTSRLDFVRYALVEGLREAERIGVNPYKLGIIASTDTHNATPGDTEESSYDGWSGVEDESPAKRLGGPATMISRAANPGGLAGVWAEENSRDALFDALARRETFGTSGPRIQPRFFGGWAYTSDLCSDPELLAKAYAGGVPMGGDLPAAPPEFGTPSFVVSALRDPGSKLLRTHALERIQIVKGWTGPDGDIHQKVYDVAGQKASAAPDLASCAPLAGGADQLCAVWRDPEFDPRQAAVYYARVLEQPSCRWTTLQCNALPEAERPDGCDDPKMPKTVQERAWTSPIWYAPPARVSP